MTDVAQRTPVRVCRMAGVACFFRVVQILKIPAALEIDQTVLAGREFMAPVVAYVQRTPIGTAYTSTGQGAAAWTIFSSDERS